MVFVGRDSKQKNLPALLEAAAPESWRVLLIGTGEADTSANAAQGQWGREIEGGRARVQRVGQVPHAALPAVLRRGRVYVMASWYEGHPKSLIEAMACGMAVVASDRPGVAEVVQHGVTGLLCEPTPTALRAAIARLLGDPALRERLGRAARVAAVERYSLERIVTLETAVLEEAIGHG